MPRATQVTAVSIAALAIASAWGCRSPRPPVATVGGGREAVVAPKPMPYVPPPERPALALPPETVEIGHSVAGRPIQALVFDGGPGCVMIIGGIHGDEPVGAALVECLAAELRAHPKGRAGRRVVVIPRMNPDGLAADTRGNARGVDLNRNFTSFNFRASRTNGNTALSEPESRALVAAIARYRPTCIVSVHGPLKCIDPDGGAASRALALRMAAVSPLPVKDLAAMPGSLGSYAGSDLGLAMITYELDRKGLPELRAGDYMATHIRALLVAIRDG